MHRPVRSVCSARLKINRSWRSTSNAPRLTLWCCDMTSILALVCRLTQIDWREFVIGVTCLDLTVYLQKSRQFWHYCEWLTKCHTLNTHSDWRCQAKPATKTKPIQILIDLTRSSRKTQIQLSFKHLCDFQFAIPILGSAMCSVVMLRGLNR